MNQFCVAYTRHFRKQFKLEDYGCFKLRQLIGAVSHTAQVVGEGPQARIRLSTYDPRVSPETESEKKCEEGLAIFGKEIAELLKSQPGHTIPMGQFTVAYQRHFKRPFKLEQYGGYTKLRLLIGAVSDTAQIVGDGSPASPCTIKLSYKNSIPMSSPDKGKIRKFAKECLELLALAPDCAIPFDKFITRYHQHFGRQLKLSDYGFGKLIDLLKAVPDAVYVPQYGKADRPVRMRGSPDPKAELKDAVSPSPAKQKFNLDIFSKELVELLRAQPEHFIVIHMFCACYYQNFVKEFRVSDCGYSNLRKLFEALPNVVKIVGEGHDTGITLAQEEGDKEEESAQQFAQECTEVFGTEERKKEFAQECVELLMDSPGCKISLDNFQDKYEQYFQRLCRPSDYGFSDLLELLEAMPDTVEVVDSSRERVLQLKESAWLSNDDPVDLIDVEDEEEGKENTPKNNVEEIKGKRNQTPVKPSVSLSQGLRRMFGFIAKKQ